MQIQDLNGSGKVLEYLKYAQLCFSVSIGGLNPTGKLIPFSICHCSLMLFSSTIRPFGGLVAFQMFRKKVGFFGSTSL